MLRGLPSYSPSFATGYTQEMSFPQRIANYILRVSAIGYVSLHLWICDR